MDYNRTAVVVAGLASAGAFALGAGLEPRWPFAWLAPLPVLAAAYRVPRGPAAGVAFGAWVLGWIPFGVFLLRSLGVPVVIAVITVVAPGIAFALFVLASRALLRRGALWSAALAFPALWVSLELLLARASPHGTAGSIAYSQSDLLPLVQLVSVTGLSGVTFLVMAVPTAVAVASAPSVTLRIRVGLILVAACVLGVTLSFGAWRLGRPIDGREVTVGLAASDVDIPLFRTTDAGAALRVIDAYAAVVDALSARGATIIVLPEKIVGVTERYATEIERRLGAAAARNRVVVVAGLNEIVTPLKRNVAVVFGTDGAVTGRYLKRYLIPGIEAGYRVGDRPLHVAGATAMWGVAICKDLDFPTLGRQYAARESALVVVPAWDFVVDAGWHERMAAMRAIESGFALARAARQGLLTVRDDRGRLIASARSDAAPMTSLAASVKVRHDATVYARWGDWFGWLCVLAAVSVLGRLASLKTGPEKESAWKATG
jgi:apolipoprotein N-acyltransferase